MRSFLTLLSIGTCALGAVVTAQSSGNIDPGIVWLEPLRQEGVSDDVLELLFGVDPTILAPVPPPPLPTGPIPGSPFDLGPSQMMVIRPGIDELPIGPLPLPPGPTPPSPFFPGPVLDFLRSAPIEELARIATESSAETSYGIAFAISQDLEFMGAADWAEDLAASNGVDHAGIVISKAQQWMLFQVPGADSSRLLGSFNVSPRPSISLERMDFNSIVSSQGEVLFSR